jgi:hypothetical protein
MAEQVLMHKNYYMPYHIGFLSDADETLRIYFDKKVRQKNRFSHKRKAVLKCHCMQKNRRRLVFHTIF